MHQMWIDTGQQCGQEQVKASQATQEGVAAGWTANVALQDENLVV